MFQALGNTVPAFLSSASRLATFVLPCLLLASYPPATLADFWLVSIAAAALQAALSLWLLRRAFRAKLPREAESGMALAPA
jgi:Na+-driven multidrug efflux pump